jgi:hypothetical protein
MPRHLVGTYFGMHIIGIMFIICVTAAFCVPSTFEDNNEGERQSFSPLVADRDLEEFDDEDAPRLLIY